MTVSLNQLVRVSILKKTSCKHFILLYNQLEEKHAINANEFSSNLLEIESEKNKLLYLEYGLTVAFSSEDRLSMFWKAFEKLQILTQSLYIKKIPEFINTHSTFISKTVIQKFINNNLKEFTIKLSKDSNAKVLQDVTFLWCFLLQRGYNIDKYDFVCNQIINLLSNSSSVDKKLLKFFIKAQKTSSDDENSNVKNNGNNNNIANSNSKNISVVSSNSSSSFNSKIFDISSTSKRYPRLLEIKKSIWINSIFEHWKPIEPKEFIKHFELNFFRNHQSAAPSTTTNLKKNILLVREIINSLFHSNLTNNTAYVVNNQKTFIVTKLVLIINELELSKQEIEEAIQETLKNSDDLQIKQDFVKSCIFNSVLDSSSFLKIFPNNPSTTSINSEILQFKNNTINGLILEDLNRRLIEVNSEFTSLEELGLVEYMKSLSVKYQFSLAKQKEVRQILNNLLNQFIKEKANDKLSRLLILLLSGSGMTLSMVFSDLNPLPFLCKIIKYVDHNNYVGGGNDDDMMLDIGGSGGGGNGNGGDSSDEYQDIYSQFGIILLSIIQIIDFFQIEQKDIIIMKQSFTLDYINNFYYRLCENLTNETPMSSTEEDNTIITNYNSLISDWIRALFDINNDEGLSDELIKLVNIKQIYKIIPLIYQQAIVSYNIGKIEFKVLNNGLDFLTQNFLIPCSLAIMKWVVRYINTTPKNEKLYEVLLSIIKSNLSNSNDGGSSDQTLVFKLVLGIVGKDILKTIISLKDTSGSIDEIKKLIENNIEKSYLSTDIVDYPKTTSLKTYLLEIIDKPTKFDTNVLVNFINNEQQTIKRMVLEDFNHNIYNNEDTKVVFNLLVVLLNNMYLQDEDDAKYWLSKLALETKQTATPRKLKKESRKFENSMANHYSAIFNIPEDEQCIEDDLFNDNFEIPDDTLIEDKSFLVVLKSINRKTSFLAELVRFNQRRPNEAIALFIGKIIKG